MRKWTKQPPTGTGIDWGNPLTRNLISAWPLHDLRDAVSGDIAVPTGGLVIRGGKAPGEVSPDFDGTNRYLACPSISAKLSGATQVTISAMVHWDSSGVEEQTVVSTTGTSDGYGEVLLRLEPSDDTIELFYYSASDTQQGGTIAGSVAPVNEWFHLVGMIDTVDRQDVSAWVNGIETGTPVAATAALDTSGSTKPLWIGASSHAGATSFDKLTGGVYGVCIWTRALSVAEIKSLARNPWQIFKGPKNFALADPLPQTRSLTVPQVWTKQPPAGVGIDSVFSPWFNPNIAGVWNLNGGNLKNTITNSIAGHLQYPSSGTHEWRATPVGFGLSFDNTSGSGNSIGMEAANGVDGFWHDEKTAFTVVIAATLEADTNGPSILFEVGGATHGLWVGYRNTPDTMCFGVGASSVYDEIASTTTYAPNDKFYIVAVYDGVAGTLKLFIDGVLEAEQTTGVPSSLPLHTNAPAIGGVDSTMASADATPDEWGGVIPMVACSLTAVPDNVALRLSANPWQIFKRDSMQVPIEYEELTFDEDAPEGLYFIERPWK